MPLYEYKCHKCGKTFEVIQKFSDEPLQTHENCGGEVERLLSAPAFHLKGTGWYATDYGKGGNGKAGAKAEDSKPETKSETKADSADSKTSTSTDSKPASGTETKTS